jgi:hypothetical protein
MTVAPFSLVVRPGAPSWFNVQPMLQTTQNAYTTIEMGTLVIFDVARN